MDDRLRSEIRAIAADTRSGATALLARGVAVLRAAAGDAATLALAADELCRAQPSMAGLRVAAAIARRAADPAAALDEFAGRTARAPRLIARHAVAVLKLRRGAGPIRVVTCSRSHAVEQTLRALADEGEVEVSCAEGRPALEGRDLALALAEAGVRVRLYTDAGISTAIRTADALVVGADAVGPDAFINKVGTGALAALASFEGVSAYVLAGREKIVGRDVFAELDLRRGDGAELGPSPGSGVEPANPYFEQVRSTLVTGFVTDSGAIAPEDIARVSI